MISFISNTNWCVFGKTITILKIYEYFSEKSFSCFHLQFDELFDSLLFSLYRDVRIENLQYGKINFDNLINAFLTVFQCLTLEGWTSVMYNFQDSYDKYWATLYFVALVLMCALLFLNIIVAILFDNYEDNDKEEVIFYYCISIIMLIGGPRNQGSQRKSWKNR